MWAQKRKLPAEEIERAGGHLEHATEFTDNEPKKQKLTESENGTEEVWNVEASGDQASWLRKDLSVVLVHPQIPQNTGSIARTCAAAGVPLHLVEPLGFELSDSKLKRAGLNYWPYVCVKQEQPRRLIAFSKFATRKHTLPGTYQKGDWLLFGAETTGLPDEAHEATKKHGQLLRIPMIETFVRSLNLAVAHGIGLYEAMRQIDEGDSPDAKDQTTESIQQHSLNK